MLSKLTKTLSAPGLALLMASLLAGTPALHAQTKLGPAATVSYDNKYEVYGGLSFMDFQAGQNLPKRMNLGGYELQGAFYMNHKLAVAADIRGEYGTTPIFPNPYGINRPLVYMTAGMAGAQYRGPKNQYAAIDYHAYGGVAYGVFDSGTQGNGLLPGTAATNAANVGLYSNRTRPIFAVGGSLDVNQSKRFALRLSPDLIVEHFGTETREFFALSGGLVYRVGRKK